MAGRKPFFNREEQRKNQVVVPLSEQEKIGSRKLRRKMTAVWHRLSEWCLMSILRRRRNKWNGL